MLRTLGGLLLLAATCLSTTAYAAEGRDDARRAFLEGVAAFQAGDYPDALERFRTADRSLHSPAITYNIARTLEKLDRPQNAVIAYEEYLVEAGEAGEFTQAATLAIVQIKARSTRLRIESSPPGATVRIDEGILDDTTPLTFLVPRGRHRITVTLEDWSESREIEGSGGGSSVELVFVRTEQPATQGPASEGEPVPPPAPPLDASPLRDDLDGLTGTLGLSISAYRFLGTAREDDARSNAQPAGLAFGLAFDVGWALSPRAALLLRAFGGLGSSERELAAVGAAGPVLSYRLGNRWWLGAGAVFGAGRAESEARRDGDGDPDVGPGSNLGSWGDTVTFQTNVAVGPTLEIGYVIDRGETGHWIVALLPTSLITTNSRESTLFLPLMLGYRWL